MIPGIPSPPSPAGAGRSDSAGQGSGRPLPLDTPLSGRVVSVSQPAGGNGYRLTVEVNSQLLQLTTSQPLAKGSLIELLQQQDGQLRVQQPAPGGGEQTSRQANQLAQQARDNVTLQLSRPQPGQPHADSPPLRQPSNGVVISSQPQPVQTSRGNVAKPQAASAATPAPASAGQPQATPGRPSPPSPPAAATGGTAGSTPAATSPAGNSPAVRTPGAMPASPGSAAPAAPTAANSASPATSSALPQGANPTAQPSAAPQASTAHNTAPFGPAAGSPAPPPASPPAAGDGSQPARPAAPQTAAATSGNGPRQPAAAQPAPNASAPHPAPRTETSQTTQTTQTTQATQHTQPPLPQQPHQLRVQLADQRILELTSPRPVAIGTQLRLDPQPDGSIQARALPPPPALPLTEQQQQLVNEQLRQALPQQQPTGEVFGQLQQLTGQNGALSRTPVANAVRSMLSLFGVTPGDIDSPEAIQRNLELGGRLTESNLAQGKGLPAQDMKAALQQLQQLGERLPEDARRQLDQLIQQLQSRHTSQQLGALQQWRELPDGGQERVIQLDLPVRQGERYDNVEVKITEEQRRQPGERFQTQWRVQLQFDLARRGQVTAELVLQQEERISGSFWCERRETASEIRQRLPAFVSQLDSQGFDVNELHCHIGRPPGNKDSVRKQLIDLKT